MEQIEDILFSEPLVETKKRGRPATPLNQLHPSTQKKRFNQRLNNILNEITMLNDYSNQNEWGLSIGVNLQVFKEWECFRKININVPEENEEALKKIILKISYLKIRHFISNETLQALLGSNRGLNYRLKAHVIIDFLKEAKKKMVEHHGITINSGSFEGGKKFSIISIKPLIVFLLTHVPQYKNLSSPV